MGKVVRKVLKVATVVGGIALAIPSGGTSLLAAVAGVSGTVASGIVAGLATISSFASNVFGRSQIPQSASLLGRLEARLDVQAPRKMVLGGPSAMPADARFLG